MKEINNYACISGVIAEGFRYSHNVYGEKFYTSIVEAERKSGVVDRVPIMVSEMLVDVGLILFRERVCVYGQFRSFNKRDGNRSHLILHLFVREFFCIDDEGYDSNSIELDGYLCKKPYFRETPLGKEIADILLAVNRGNGRTDYIPCIAWWNNARCADALDIGTHLKITGRIQSREYIKQITEEYAERRTAYEVSISQMEVIESEECKDQVADAE